MLLLLLLLFSCWCCCWPACRQHARALLQLQCNFHTSHATAKLNSVLTSFAFAPAWVCSSAWAVDLVQLQNGGPSGGSHGGRHTTEDGPGMQSILERNDLDELMAMVRHTGYTVVCFLRQRGQYWAVVSSGHALCNCQHSAAAALLEGGLPCLLPASTSMSCCSCSRHSSSDTIVRDSLRCSVCP